MVRTYGLTHINLVVRDVERSLRFYGQVFGVEEYGRTEGLVHTRTPGCQDVITFDEHSSGAGDSRGIPHFGAVKTDRLKLDQPRCKLGLAPRSVCGASNYQLSNGKSKSSVYKRVDWADEEEGAPQDSRMQARNVDACEAHVPKQTPRRFPCDGCKSNGIIPNYQQVPNRCEEECTPFCHV
jgi:hypothetical protein